MQCTLIMKSFQEIHCLLESLIEPFVTPEPFNMEPLVILHELLQALKCKYQALATSTSYQEHCILSA